MNAASARRLGTIAGILVVLSIFAGGFAEVYVPGKLLVPADPVATSRNVAESAAMFRCSFAVYLLEAICDITLALVLYELLKPVNRVLSLLAAFFGLVSTSTFATSELFYFLASVPILDSDVRGHLGPGERNLFTYAALTLYGYGGSLFMVFYGIATMLRGFLICRSTYLPAWLGALLLVAGAGFILKNFMLVLAPSYDSGYLLAPMFLAMIALAGRLLVKGVDTTRWPERVSP
ncbi:DUF4386 domain-containing protein [Fulvimonas sp. R45]|uniref:DUF4386 domain-containing protein n=1 Tax=Fulvimonas sp. R45 TaxID=3045937 RepID=UPI00265EDAA9|nr:DUF4386 domain-containing protein [Fulvimonas sp. R45]MDO1529264.1 DUF4386 domain-containing protein [Fulvimonas sp. R45]